MPATGRTLLAALVLTLGIAAPAVAQTFTVTTTLDGPAACTPAACTLRAAVTAANADSAADVIVLGPGEYRLALGAIGITEDTVIRGAGAEATLVVAGPNARIFTNAAAADTTLEGVTLTGADRIGNPAGDGGAIQNTGNLTLDHAAVVGNRITGTVAAVLSGGGVTSTGPLTIRDSRISGNAVVTPGGGIPQGGGVYATGTTTVDRSSIADNDVSATGVGGVPQGGGIMVQTPGSLTVTASRIERNRALGGSIPQGGGIGAQTADLSLTDSTVSGNLARTVSAGIAQASALFSTGNALTITRSAITDNTTVEDAGVSGGGIGEGPVVKSGGTLTLNTSTIAGNRSTGNVTGSTAIKMTGGAADTLNVTGSTIAGNSAIGSGPAAAVRVIAPATGTLTNTILTGNTSNGTPQNCGPVDRPASSGHNLTDDATCAFAGPGDRSGDPALGPLGDNGGLTPTRALLAGSPAIDAGDPAACAATDQRGVTRVGVCDIGAFEFVPPPPPPPPAPAPPVAPAGKPLPALKAGSVLRLPPATACLSRRQLRLTLKLPAGAAAKSVAVVIGKRRLPVVTGKRLKAPIDLRGLPKGRFKVTVTLRTLDGRSATLTRTYRTCAPKRKR